MFALPVTDYRPRTKEALVVVGVLECVAVRPPLLPIGEAERVNLRAALRRAGLLA